MCIEKSQMGENTQKSGEIWELIYHPNKEKKAWAGQKDTSGRTNDFLEVAGEKYLWKQEWVFRKINVPLGD